VETKNDLMAEICNLLGMPEYKTSVGSSIPRRFFSELLDYFGLPDEGDSVQAAKALVSAGNLEWKSEFDSSDSPSGGGGTVTLTGLKAVRQAVSILLDEQEAELTELQRPGFDPAQSSEWTLLKGQSILRRLLHDRYGGTRQGGIAPSARTQNIFLFTDESSNNEHGYESDHWLNDETFLYCGGGQSGNQSLTRFNYAILNHKEDGKKLRLFSPASGSTTYLGELEIDSKNPYEWIKGYGRDGSLREVVMFRLLRVYSENKIEANTIATTSAEKTFGVDYRYADENSRQLVAPDLFTTDPSLLDRALQIHALTQNVVANWVMASGLTPLSPNEFTCDFDLAWDSPNGKVVCEVKSISDANEKHQFRLGLGQVLEYAHSLDALPVLFFSRKPTNVKIIDIAKSAGVRVLWPEMMSSYSPRDMRIVRNA
jgi:hypothetical protein